MCFPKLAEPLSLHWCLLVVNISRKLQVSTWKRLRARLFFLARADLSSWRQLYKDDTRLIRLGEIQVCQVHVAFQNDVKREYMNTPRQRDACEVFHVVPMVPLPPRDRVQGIVGGIDMDQGANILPF